MLFLCCDEKLPPLLILVNIRRSITEKASFYHGLWASTTSILWDYWDPICLPTAYARKLAFERCMSLQLLFLMFLGWQSCEIFVVPLARRLETYLSTPVRRTKLCQPAGTVAVPTAPCFVFKLSFLMLCASSGYVWIMLLSEHCNLTFCAFPKNCRFVILVFIHHDRHMCLV